MCSPLKPPYSLWNLLCQLLIQPSSFSALLHSWSHSTHCDSCLKMPFLSTQKFLLLFLLPTLPLEQWVTNRLSSTAHQRVVATATVSSTDKLRGRLCNSGVLSTFLPSLCPPVGHSGTQRYTEIELTYLLNTLGHLTLQKKIIPPLGPVSSHGGDFLSLIITTLSTIPSLLLFPLLYQRCVLDTVRDSPLSVPPFLLWESPHSCPEHCRPTMSNVGPPGKPISELWWVYNWLLNTSIKTSPQETSRQMCRILNSPSFLRLSTFPLSGNGTTSP